MAVELGKLIKESDEMKKLALAESAYEADEELMKLINEYNAQDEALQNSDGSVNDAIRARMDELYEQVTRHPVYEAYMEAQHEVQLLMHKVNDEINFGITGEHACTHDCSTCGGCH